ncbi:helix-turn-helix domain-containing protein [Lentilactobacillus sp. SPB1-3]|uniref:Helix-turn-helix domain-containing protein n=1 Tax=Lentilactobacillus terminaliae TaxID=3003483 RepID=A0ACD5DF48_9LACO|nr:helix-turn-helix transcriptional regulator [Lentilactobacillus sp. SPB1-3]MCZ0976424.1 helix-turn-helix transcriptional regulator [Lentilactobacillus sp. SPB1-3]
MTIGERIKELRTINGITQQELADSLHISRQSISKWEKNLVWPSFANVVAISDKFDVSLDEMIRGDEQFMESLEHRKVNTNIAKIIGFGILIAVIAIILSAIIGFKEENLINVMSLIQAIAFLYMALNVNWRKINDSLSTKGIINAIIWFASLAIPQITDFVSGFINGMNH